jgi:hypothetical protein
MSRAKQKQNYSPAWTPQHIANWQALGAFIARMRLEGKIAKPPVSHG